MSDPVTNIEIEDVLSSIRRLVSEENRGETAAKAPETAQSDKLVLTPALRVEDPVEPVQEGGDAEPEDDAGEGSAVPWNDPDATLFAAAEAAGTPPETASDMGDAEEDWADAVAEDGDDTGASPVESDPDADADHTASAEPEAQDDPGDEIQTAPDWNKEAPGEDDVRGAQDAAPDGAGRDDPEAVSDDAVFGPAEDDVVEPDTEVVAQAPEGDDDRSLSERFAELEQRISEADEEWEPDGTGTGDYAGTAVETLEWQDHVENSGETAQTVDPSRYMDSAQDEDEVEDEDIDVLANDETFLDEESLRELVADIVRQELQGALGERITRNVRKLVRREIHRALTAQELE